MLKLPEVSQQTSFTSSKEDNVTGKYYKRYYALKITSGSSLLVPYTLDADTNHTDYSRGTAGEVSGAILYDLTFDRHTQVGGRMFINTSIRQTVNDANAHTWIRFYAKKVDSTGNETYLAVEQSPTSTGGDNAWRYCISVDVPTTRIRPSEKLRIVEEYWGSCGGPGMAGIVYHDPTGRLNTVVGDGVHTNHATTLIVDVPFTQQAEY